MKNRKRWIKFFIWFYEIENKHSRWLENFKKYISFISSDDLTSRIENKKNEFSKLDIIIIKIAHNFDMSDVHLKECLSVLISFNVYYNNYNTLNNINSFRNLKMEDLVICINIESGILRLIKLAEVDLFWFFPNASKDKDFVLYCLKYSLIIKLLLDHRCFGLIYKKGEKVLNLSYISEYSVNSSGWSVIIDNSLFKKVGILQYIGKPYKLKPLKIEYHGDMCVGDVVSNDKYSNPVWINNNKLIKYMNDGYNLKYCDPTKILNAINWLNSSKYYINYDYYIVISNFLLSDHKLAEFYLSNSKGFLKLSNLDENKINRLNSIKIIMNEVKGLRNNNFVYLTHLLDSRGRIYVNSLPINYQLDRFVRSFLYVKSDISKLEVWNNFIIKYDIKNIIKSYKIFMVQKLNSNLFNKLVNSKFFNIDVNVDINYNLDNFINAEIACTLAFRLGNGVTFEEKVDSGLNIIEQINKKNFLDLGCSKQKNIKKLVEIINMYYHISEKNLENIAWYNDASSNVIQLLIMKLFIYDEHILRVSNIFTNNTEYSNIYEFISFEFKKKSNNTIIKEIINPAIVKIRIMKGAYGQTYLEFNNDIKKIINNSSWESLNEDEKNETLKIIYDTMFDFLGETGEIIKNYLKFCKEYAKDHKKCRWISNAGIPVFITKEKIINRSEKRKKIIKLLHESKDNSKSIDRINNSLNDDDINYLRKNLTIRFNNNNHLIKIRYRKKSNEIDKNKLQNSLCASSIHADDASILIHCINELKEINIPCFVIHDSIGSEICYSSIIKFIFKIKNIHFLKEILENDCFPFIDGQKNDFIDKRDKRKNNFIEKFEKIKLEILESDNFFN